MKGKDVRALGDLILGLAESWPDVVDALEKAGHAQKEQTTAEHARDAAAAQLKDAHREHGDLKKQMEQEQAEWTERRAKEGKVLAAELQAYREKVEGDLTAVLARLHAQIATAKEEAIQAGKERDAAKAEAHQTQEYLTAVKAQLANIKVGIPA